MMRVSIVFISCVLAVSAEIPDHCEEGSAECSVEEEAANVGLLHTKSKLSRSSPADTSGACHCLRYQDLYQTNAVSCGSGSELLTAPDSFMTQMMMSMSMGQEFCQRFFTKRSDNYCQNTGFSASPDQWCYVSSQCMDLNGGHAITARQGYPGVAMKMCTSADASLKDLMPEPLHNFAQTNGFDYGLLMKFAYPTVNGTKWPDVRAFFEPGANTAAMPSHLQQTIDANLPVVFDSISGHPPFAAVHGRRAYEVTLDMAYLTTADQMTLNPFQISTMQCLGC